MPPFHTKEFAPDAVNVVLWFEHIELFPVTVIEGNEFIKTVTELIAEHPLLSVPLI